MFRSLLQLALFSALLVGALCLMERRCQGVHPADDRQAWLIQTAARQDR